MSVTFLAAMALHKEKLAGCKRNFDEKVELACPKKVFLPCLNPPTPGLEGALTGRKGGPKD